MYTKIKRSFLFFATFFLSLHCLFCFCSVFFRYVRTWATKQAWLLLEFDSDEWRREREGDEREKADRVFSPYHYCRSFCLSCVDKFTQFFLSSFSAFFWQPIYVSSSNARVTFFSSNISSEFLWISSKVSQRHTRKVCVCVYICASVFTIVHACRVNIRKRVLVRHPSIDYVDNW